MGDTFVKDQADLFDQEQRNQRIKEEYLQYTDRDLSDLEDSVMGVHARLGHWEAKLLKAMKGKGSV